MGETGNPSRQRPVEGSSSPRRPLIIGHRGFRARYPENTAAGVRAALAAGADGVEIDIRPTADGVWVAHHDLRRKGRHSRDWNWAEMAGDGVDPLDRILDQLDSRHWLFLEIKPLPNRWLEPLLDSLVATVGPHGNRTRILSSSTRILLAAAEAFGGIHFSLVINRPGGVSHGFFSRARGDVRRSGVLTGADLGRARDMSREPLPGETSQWQAPRRPQRETRETSGLDSASLPGTWSLSPHHVLVERLLPAGRELHPWTVNRRARLLQMARLGLPSVTTDNPELALSVLG